MNAIKDGIYDLLVSDSNITDVVGSGDSARIYRGKAPQEATYPLIVYSFSGGGDVTDNPSEGSNTLWLIQALSTTSEAEAGSIADDIRSLFRRAKESLTVSGWVNIWTDIQNKMEQVLHDSGTGKQYWHSGYFVRVRLTKSV